MIPPHGEKTTLLVLYNTPAIPASSPLKDSKERCLLEIFPAALLRIRAWTRLPQGVGWPRFLSPAHRQSTTWTQAMVRQADLPSPAAHSPLAEESSSFPLSLIRYASQSGKGEPHRAECSSRGNPWKQPINRHCGRPW